MNSRHTRWLVRGIFAAVFAFAGILKVADPIQFLADIRTFQLVRDPFAAAIALGLPWLEIFAALAVFVGFGRAGGLLVLNALLIVFLAILSLTWWRGLDPSCGCFGAFGGESIFVAMVRDGVLLMLGSMLWRSDVRSAVQPVTR